MLWDVNRLQATGQDALEEKLNRLSKKAGVKASLVLDRNTGAILKTSGQTDALRTAKSRKSSTAASFSNETPVDDESESKGIDDFAGMIWNFVKNSGNMIHELDTDVRTGILTNLVRKHSANNPRTN